MNPYENLPDHGFWKLAVGMRDPLSIGGLWIPKLEIGPGDKFVTYGSCFAQHIGRALKARRFCWTNFEPGPKGLSEAGQKLFNYGVFSSRTGNIYTATLLRQWIQWASGVTPLPDEFWQSEGRFFDPFRPAIEPGGFASAKEVAASREHAIACFRKSIEGADIFVFTMGLTESWFNSQSGCEYPMCPGTVAGEFDPDSHVFVNQNFSQILDAMSGSFDLMQKLNKNIRFLVTVSPVPLTATMSGKHVLTATTHSKSILRAVAGELADRRDCVDYFPSYEIITSPPFGGRFYEGNMRSVTKAGVDFVMDSFFDSLTGNQGTIPDPTIDMPRAESIRQNQEMLDDIQCEEQILEAFSEELGK